MKRLTFFQLTTHLLTAPHDTSAQLTSRHLTMGRILQILSPMVICFALSGHRHVHAEKTPFPVPVDVALGADGAAIVTTTSGAFVRGAGQRRFHFVCAAEIGSGADAFAPLAAFSADQKFLATSYAGLFRSNDGCSFERAPLYQNKHSAPFTERWISAIESTHGSTWIGTADAHNANDIYLSAAPEQPFYSLGLTSPTDWYLSVIADNAGKVYVTGYRVAGERGRVSAAQGLIFYDRQVVAGQGIEWGRSGRSRALLAGADGEIWLVIEAALEPSRDVVYQSIDHGSTFTRIIEASGTIVGAVTADDGTHWFASTGGCSGSRAAGCLYRVWPRQNLTSAQEDSPRVDAPRVEAVDTPALSCLTQSPSGTIVGCRKDLAVSGVVLDRLTWPQIAATSAKTSTEHSETNRAQSIGRSPLLLASEILGPCATTVTCQASWRRHCRFLGADCTSRGPTVVPSLLSPGPLKRTLLWLWLALVFTSALLPWLIWRRCSAP